MLRILIGLKETQARAERVHKPFAVEPCMINEAGRQS